MSSKEYRKEKDEEDLRSVTEWRRTARGGGGW